MGKSYELRVYVKGSAKWQEGVQYEEDKKVSGSYFGNGDDNVFEHPGICKRAGN